MSKKNKSKDYEGKSQNKGGLISTGFFLLLFIGFIYSSSIIKEELGFTPIDVIASSFTVTDMNFKYSCEEEGYLLDSKTCIIGDEDNATYDYFLNCKGYTEHKFTNLDIEIEYPAKIRKYCTYGRVQIKGE